MSKERFEQIISKSQQNGWQSLTTEEINFVNNFSAQDTVTQEGFASWDVAMADINNKIGKDLLPLAEKAWKNSGFDKDKDPQMKYKWFSDWFENYKNNNIEADGDYKPYAPDLAEEKGDTSVLKNIYSYLKGEKLLKDNDIAFDDWVLGVGPQEKFNIHRLLKQQGLTESDYNTWQKNSFGVVDDVEVNPNDVVIEEYDENPEEWMGLPLNKKGLITATVLNKDNQYTFSDNSQWNETVNKAIKAGTHAYDPETGALVKLENNVDAADQDVALNTKPTMASDNFQQERLRVNSELDNLYNNPPLDDNGNVDINALNAKIAEIDDKSTFLEFNPGNVEDEMLKIKTNNQNDVVDFFDTYKALKFEQGQKGFLDAQNKIKGINVEGDTAEEKTRNFLIQNKDKLWSIAEQNGVSREDFEEYFSGDSIESSGRSFLTKKFGGSLEDLLLDAIDKKGYTEEDMIAFQTQQLENEKLFNQWKAGEIELSTAELAKITKVTDGAKQYAKTFLPEIESITDPGEAYKVTLNKLVADDPQFQTIQNSITTQLQEDSLAYMDSIKDKYNIYTQEGLEFLQEDMKEWWNKSYNEAIQKNPEAIKLFQEYAASLNANFSDYIRDFDRYQDDGLRWVDEQFEYYGEEGEGSDSWAAAWNRGRAQVYEMARKLPGSTELRLITKPLAAWASNEIQNRKGILNYLDGLDSNMTLGEARKDNAELDHFLTFNDWVWTDGDTVGDYIDRKEMRLENSEERAVDIFTDMIQQQADEMIYKQYDNKAAFGLTEGFSLEGFMQTIAQGVDQLPHMLPSVAGSIIGTAGLISGNPILIKTGVGLAATSAGIQGAMAYGETFMEATERFINENPDYVGKRLTGEDYVEILKSSEYDIDSGLFSYPAMAGLSVMGSEFISDVIGQRIGGGAAKWVFKNPLTTKLMSNTFTNYLLKAGYGITAMEAGSAKEFLTEGFQSYLEQGFTNATAGQSSPFTTNISVDDILMEARMGKKMGYLFGGGTAIGGIAGSSTDINNILTGSYSDRAMKIAENIDMTPGSKTFVASEAAFKDLQNDILNDQNLKDDQKQQLILDLNDTRNAGLKIPADIKGERKRKLIAALKEKASLNRRIKTVDDSDISALDIKRRNEVSAEIQNIVGGNQVVDAELDLDENISNVRNIINKTSKGQIELLDLADSKAIDKYTKDNNLNVKLSSNQGSILQDPKTGKQTILINRDVALKDQAVNVAGHEFLHALLFETVKNSPETAIKLGNALDEHLASLSDIDIDQIKNSDYKKKERKSKKF